MWVLIDTTADDQAVKDDANYLHCLLRQQQLQQQQWCYWQLAALLLHHIAQGLCMTGASWFITCSIMSWQESAFCEPFCAVFKVKLSPLIACLMVIKLACS